MTEERTTTNSLIRDRFIQLAGKTCIAPVVGVGLLIHLFFRMGLPFLQTLAEEFSCVLLIVSYTLYALRLNYSLSAINRQEKFWSEVNSYFSSGEHIWDNVLKGLLALTVGVLVFVLFSSEIKYKGDFFEWIFLFILGTSVGWELLINNRLSKLVKSGKIQENSMTIAFSCWLKLDILLATFLAFAIIYPSIDAFKNYPLVNVSAFFWINILFSAQDLIRNQQLLLKGEVVNV